MGPDFGPVLKEIKPTRVCNQPRAQRSANVNERWFFTHYYVELTSVDWSVDSFVVLIRLGGTPSKQFKSAKLSLMAATEDS